MKNKITALLTTGMLLLAIKTYAGSATWKQTPTSSDWNTANNWTPATVPNGPADIATFTLSSTSPSIRDFIEVSSVVFNPGASAFSIAVDPDDSTGHSASLTLSGAGITNNSGITQGFAAVVDGFSSGAILFTGSATAGSQTTFLNEGGSLESGGSETQFLDESNAGSATFTNEGGSGFGGDVQFFDNSSAADGTFTCQGAEFTGWSGGFIFFWDSSTAANATFVANGGIARNAGGAHVDFFSGSPTAGNATLVANGGTGGGDGGTIFFSATSDGGTAQVDVFGNGELNIALHDAPGVTIGSLLGDGEVNLGDNNLSIGNGNRDSRFDGVVTGTGSLAKLGLGMLRLTGANTYSGGTTVVKGILLVDNTTGSGTGTGPVQVNGYVLGGSGTIGGSLTVGDNRGSRTALAPSQKASAPTTLTILGSLTLRAETLFRYRIDTETGVGDVIVANGVNIDGAGFFGIDKKRKQLPAGTVITVINNTSANPIQGQFDNLGDGDVVFFGVNNYAVSFHGGDGNDLTFTVL